MEIIIENKVIKGIPTLSCNLENNQQKPLILFSHGFRKNNKSQIQFIKK